MFELGDSKLNEDIVVPMKNYVKFAAFLERLRRESKLSIPTFGHLGDGNLHVNIMYHRADPVERRAAEKAVKRLMETVVALGGAISGEHGIGLAKTPFLHLQHSPAQVRAMRPQSRQDVRALRSLEAPAARGEIALGSQVTGKEEGGKEELRKPEFGVSRRGAETRRSEGFEPNHGPSFDLCAFAPLRETAE
jgi:hypothetical protein